MKHLFLFFISNPTPATIQAALAFLRISIGLLTLGHGLPKIMGGASTWLQLGGVMSLFGIHFLPVLWGCIAACTEFFGGLALVLGLGTKISSFFNLIMMLVALRFHISNNDSFNVYSFALTMIAIFIFFMIVGSGSYSLDHYLSNK